ncbi:MAG: DarT ssDNA thymidine ADP-ribosyltransferase family protein, partial [Candidatus Binatia bacterium]
DRARRRQAEFLVHRFVPWELVSSIGVVNTYMKNQVEELLRRSNHHPGIAVQRNWYY